MPVDITYREDKGSKLTSQEVDENFRQLADAVAVTGLSSTMPNGKIYIGNSLNTGELQTLNTDLVPESTDKKYVSDAELVVIGNASGTNTGDNAVNTNSNDYTDDGLALKLDLDGGNANQDIDIGTNSFKAKNLKVNGTGGAGHISLKHQSANITASASESSIGANSTGDPVWKNDGNAIDGLELISRKTDTVAGNEASSTKYLSVKGVYDWATNLFAPKSNPTFTGTLTTPDAIISNATANTPAFFDGTKKIVTALGTTFGTWLNGLSPKTTPVNGDVITILDSANSFEAKKSTISELATTLGSNFVMLTTNQNVDGTKTFLKDIKVNGITFGKGGGNQASNTAGGIESLLNNVDGTGLTAYGFRALERCLVGGNTAGGYLSASSVTTGGHVTAWGYQSFLSLTDGGYGVAVGTNAGTGFASANFMTVVGASSAIGLTGSRIDCFGYYSGGASPVKTHFNVMFLGCETKSSSVSQISNSIALGYLADVLKSDCIQLGNTSIKEISTRGVINPMTTAVRLALTGIQPGYQCYDSDLKTNATYIGGAIGLETSWNKYTGGGSGSVASVSVVTANGISGSVATSTTTPAITLTLGAITPTSVNGIVFSGSSTPTLAVTGTSSISGANTGDNAVNSLYSGLVSNATHTGDATGSTALTVVRINGTSLAGLTTGLLKNTTGTGVPSIAVQSDITALLGAGSITNSMLTNSAVASLSGTNTGDQTITLTGGVTGSGTGSFTATVVTNADLTGVVTSVGNATSIANGAITDAMLATTYLTAEVDTLNTVVSRGSYCYSDITVRGVVVGIGSGNQPSNTVIGNNVFASNTLGFRCTAVGANAGNVNDEGYDNVYIGALANGNAGNLHNSTAIGFNAIVTASNTIQLGNTSVTQVTTSGKIKAGSVTYINTVGVSGQVLSINGSGVTSWINKYSTDNYFLGSDTVSPLTAFWSGGAYFGSTKRTFARTVVYSDVALDWATAPTGTGTYFVQYSINSGTWTDFHTTGIAVSVANTYVTATSNLTITAGQNIQFRIRYATGTPINGTGLALTPYIQN